MSYQQSELEKEIYEMYFGGDMQYTWDDFYRKMREEKAAGKTGCPEASYMALQLLRKRILSIRIDNDNRGYEDLYQDAYLEISRQISRYDENFEGSSFENRQASFGTYMSKWIDGLASSIRGGGVSAYDKKIRGISLTSSDAIAERKNDNGDARGFEVRDEKYEIETILEEKERRNEDSLLRNLYSPKDYENEEGLFDSKKAKKNLYREATYLKLLFGGFTNLPEDWRSELVL